MRRSISPTMEWGRGWETALEIYNTAHIKVTGSIFSEIHAEEATTGKLIVGSENATLIIKNVGCFFSFLLV